MDLHKTICISAPAHWKAIDRMIMTAGPRNCSKMCNHFVCCIYAATPTPPQPLPPFSFTYQYSLGLVQQSKVIFFRLGPRPAQFPFRFEAVFLTYHRPLLCIQGCFILNVMQMGCLTWPEVHCLQQIKVNCGC